MRRTIVVYDNADRETGRIVVGDGYLASAIDPFAGIVVDGLGNPALGDVDGDGLIDLVAGSVDGSLTWYRNTGTAGAAAFEKQTGEDADPFFDVDVGTASAPVLADVDGDGLIDLVAGQYSRGSLNYYRNTGAVGAPAFTRQTGNDNPFSGVDIRRFRSAPVLEDVDGDGDLDLLVGTVSGLLHYYRNTGAPGAPAFTLQTDDDDPFQVADADGKRAPIDVGDGSVPVLGDIDGDGDLDLVVGEGSGGLKHYENVGTTAKPMFVERIGTANPFDGVALDGWSAPAVADLNGDGLLDLVVGDLNGVFRHFAPEIERVVRYVFDDDGARIGRVEIESRTGEGGVTTVTRSYDADGGLTGRVDTHDVDGDGTADRTVTWTLDAKGREIGRAEDADADGIVDRTETFTFDADGGRTGSTEDTDGDGVDDRTVTWTFGADGERIGSVRVDAFDADGDGIADRIETSAFDATDNLTARTDVEDRDDDGEPDMIVIHDVDGNGREIGFTTHAIGSAYAESGADLFSTVDAGADSRPVPADLNGDGLVDLVVGKSDGSLTWHENAGTVLKPAFAERTGADNPFRVLVDGVHEAIDAGEFGLPALVDLDGDGDLDLVAGELDGAPRHYENVGTTAAATFVERVGRGVNPFHDVAATAAALAFGDVDGDEDLDLVIVEAFGLGSPTWYENTGTASAPAFTERTGGDNPFTGVDAGRGAAPTLADVDVDGLLDFVSGEASGRLIHYRNEGTTSAPAFAKRAGEVDPFADVDAGRGAAPALADFDGDGVPDLAVGGEDGDLRRFTRLEVVEVAAWTFDVRGERIGYVSDTNGDGTRDRTVTFVYGENGERDGYVRTDTEDTDGDGIVDRTATRTFDEHGREIGHTRTDTRDADGDGNVDGTEFRTFDASGRLTERIDAQDVDDDGSVDRRLTYRLDENGREIGHVVDFKYEAAAVNPFGDIELHTTKGTCGALTLADMDGDGDLDLVTGNATGTLNYYRNTGTATMPMFVEQTGTANPFADVDVAEYNVPVLADVDGDGLFDLLVAEYGYEDGSVLSYHRNAGTAAAPTFVEQSGTADPFADVDLGAFGGVPVLADVDGDGAIDLLMAEYGYEDGGTLNYYRNTGTSTKPVFELRKGNSNPFDGIAADIAADFLITPALADVDGDGDTDLLVGELYDTSLTYYENTGRPGAPAFVARSGPFDVLIRHGYGVPVLEDVDGDGSLDLVTVEGHDAINYFTLPTRTVVTYTFDGAGKRIGHTEDTDDDGDAERIVTYTFDGSENEIGRIRTDYVDADGDGRPDGTEVRTFDANGRLTGRTDAHDADGDGTADRTVVFTFDADGRETGYTEDMDGDGAADRTVSYSFDASGGQIGYKAVDFVYAVIDSSPFAGVDVDRHGTPAPGDVDGDGLIDLVVGEADGTLNWYRNAGSAAAPAFVERTGNGNPFEGVDVGAYATPALGDVDGDGDLDLVVGEHDGTLKYHENTTPEATTEIPNPAPRFEERTGNAGADPNPFHDVDVDDTVWRDPVLSAPVLADLDGDGDLDLVVGEWSGALNYYENTTPAAAVGIPSPTPRFERRIGSDGDNPNPFHGIDAGFWSKPALGDVDGDGDLDLVLGKHDGTLDWYANTGSSGAPTFAARTAATDSSGDVDTVYYSAPTFADANGDGVVDLLIGGFFGGVDHFARLPAKTVTFTFDVSGERTGRTVDTDDDGDADRFEGNDRNNVLMGGDEADVLVGNGGADTLRGGLGTDIFVFGSGDGADVVGDFADGSDRIEFNDGTIGAFGDLKIAASGGNAVIAYGDEGDTITLTAVSVADLKADDFIFG